MADRDPRIEAADVLLMALLLLGAVTSAWYAVVAGTDVFGPLNDRRFLGSEDARFGAGFAAAAALAFLAGGLGAVSLRRADRWAWAAVTGAVVLGALAVAILLGPVDRHTEPRPRELPGLVQGLAFGVLSPTSWPAWGVALAGVERALARRLRRSRRAAVAGHPRADDSRRMATELAVVAVLVALAPLAFAAAVGDPEPAATLAGRLAVVAGLTVALGAGLGSRGVRRVGLLVLAGALAALAWAAARATVLPPATVVHRPGEGVLHGVLTGLTHPFGVPLLVAAVFTLARHRPPAVESGAPGDERPGVAR